MTEPLVRLVTLHSFKWGLRFHAQPSAEADRLILRFGGSFSAYHFDVPAALADGFIAVSKLPQTGPRSAWMGEFLVRETLADVRDGCVVHVDPAEEPAPVTDLEVAA